VVNCEFRIRQALGDELVSNNDRFSIPNRPIRIPNFGSSLVTGHSARRAKAALGRRASPPSRRFPIEGVDFLATDISEQQEGIVRGQA